MKGAVPSVLTATAVPSTREAMVPIDLGGRGTVPLDPDKPRVVLAMANGARALEKIGRKRLIEVGAGSLGTWKQKHK